MHDWFLSTRGQMRASNETKVASCAISPYWEKLSSTHQTGSLAKDTHIHTPLTLTHCRRCSLFSTQQIMRNAVPLGSASKTWHTGCILKAKVPLLHGLKEDEDTGKNWSGREECWATWTGDQPTVNPHFFFQKKKKNRLVWDQFLNSRMRKRMEKIKLKPVFYVGYSCMAYCKANLGILKGTARNQSIIFFSLAYTI